MFKRYEDEIEILEQDFASRSLIPIKKSGEYIFWKDKNFLNLSSNDYLGIASDKTILDDFWGRASNANGISNSGKTNFLLGSSSSRLLTGNDSVYNDLECVLKNLYKKQAALIFNSGYHANIGIISALAGKKDAVFSDKLNHASIIDGARLSGAKLFRYKHLDYAHLEDLLKNHRHDFENAIIISESVFSMDGDIADLKKLVELKKKFDGILIVDEAHAFGVFGTNALGICEEQDCIKDIDIIAATFGKAIGSVGAFCTGDKILIDYLINKSRPLIFSTALPEINVAFSKYVLENIIPNTIEKRKKLISNAEKLRTQIKENNLKTLGQSHIIPVILGSNKDTVKICEQLQKQNLYTLPIRHPSVPLNSSRIRISLRADIDFEQIKHLPRLIAALT